MAQQLTQRDPAGAGIGAIERAAGVEALGFARGKDHDLDLEAPRPRLSDPEGNLWTSPRNSASCRFDPFGSKRSESGPPALRFDPFGSKRKTERRRTYFLPWFLTASMEAAAASGSR